MLWNKLNKKARQTKSTEQSSSRDIGQLTEELAAQYLIANGLTLVAKNFHCRGGEIDLIMMDKQSYIFVEVKYRRSKEFGGAIAAISPSKQRKIKHCVTFYLHQAGLNEYNTSCRIDVITLEGDINNPQITWLKNAF